MARAMSEKSKDPAASLLQMYRLMIRIRLLEEKVNDLFLQGHVPGTIHLYKGEEAVAVGVCCALEPDDVILGTHRPHGQAIAKGIEPKRILAEVLGKSTGCCRGKGGSMHVGDIAKGMLPALAIVSAGIPIAAGVALSFKMRKLARVAVSFFGDGATNEGAFHEGLNIAAVWKLPVVFICENNLYGVSTPIRDVTTIENLADRAASYGMRRDVVDGNDVEEVRKAASDAVALARNGEGPSLIECKTYRHTGHSRSDPARYRPKGELESWLARDPLKITRSRLAELGIAAAQMAELERDEAGLIESAAEFAVQSEPPPPATALEDVWDRPKLDGRS
jgi:TPP-dependent pyruvate/acetoin dehydrogenase alpha subunit